MTQDNGEEMTGSNDCPECGTPMLMADVDLYKCPKCGKEIDMFEEESL